MLFGLMNKVLQPFLGNFIMGNFEDIHVYSKNKDEQLKHLEAVFTVLRDQKLYTKMEK